MKKYIVAGNWKLYIESLEAAKKLASAVKRKSSRILGVEVVLLPPAPFVAAVSLAVKNSAVSAGAQAVSPFGGGAYTGAVSAHVLKEAGATWVLVGHSERRASLLDGIQGAGETEETIQTQVQAVVDAGLTVLLCVGERERDPQGSHFATIASQLSSALKHVSKRAAKLVVAYEPVWAIGKTSAEAMKPAELEEMVIFIRRTLTELLERNAALKVPILYGGSVDGTNARGLLEEGGVSGFLVGRASTDIDSFVEILNACKK